MKSILAKCKKCGDVEVTYFEGGDGELSIPVELCTNIETLGKYYKKMVGASYKQNTGNKMSESFERGMCEPSHLCPDDVGYELMKEHTLEPIECWIETV